MAGGTPEHAALAAAAIGLLFAQLRGGNCRVFDSDLRVRTSSGLSTYPDVAVICGPSERDQEDPQAVTNPTLIIEVLSRSTEDYDEGDKFEHYKTLASLKQYVLVSHRDRSLKVWTRESDNRWQSGIVREGATAELLVGARLDVRELYDAAAEPRV
jgi:Uma2 family endonuclease